MLSASPRCSGAVARAASTPADVELWDSLGHLRVCMALEERYGVQIPMEEVGELQSVPAILKYLADK